ncbi:MAG: hypothetical protein ACOCXA_00370, partial [Planctomycetota bacterium]
MIDIIFLLIIFFILAGKITSDMKSELITVPPTTTAEKIDIPDDWGHLVIDIFGAPKDDREKDKQEDLDAPKNTIKVGATYLPYKGKEDFSAYIRLRQILDRKYAEANKRPDPDVTGLMLPQVIVEIRSDMESDFRMVQEVQMVLSDAVKPDGLLARGDVPLSQMRPFVNILFTTRAPGDITTLSE